MNATNSAPHRFVVLNDVISNQKFYENPAWLSAGIDAASAFTVKHIGSYLLQGILFGQGAMNFRSIDLNLLVALDVLLSERSVTKAAARLHLSQPATSALLGKLRELFNDQLLVRTAKGMKATPRAQALVAPIRQVLADISQIVELPGKFDPQHANTTFTIHTSDYVELTLIPKLVAYLKRHSPGTNLVILPIDYETIRWELESGEVDMCITTRIVSASLHSVQLYAEQPVCISRRKHPGIGKRMTLDKLCSHDHIIVPTPMSAQVNKILKAAGRRRRIVLTVPHYFMLPTLVATTDMIAIVPERLAQLYADRLSIYESPIAMERFPITVLWHERTDRNPAHAWLRQVLMGLCGGR